MSYSRNDIEKHCHGFRYFSLPKGVEIIVDSVKEEWDIENGRRIWVYAKFKTKPTESFLMFESLGREANSFEEFINIYFEKCNVSSRKDYMLSPMPQCSIM